MQKNLLIIFAKNIELGKVKTRLAKTIGNKNAYEVYKHLVRQTEKNTRQLKNCDVHIYYSNFIQNENRENHAKFIQKGNDLGERMKDAFQRSFEKGYEKVVGIGTDIPDLSVEIITQAFEELDVSDSVFGPAEDGGYYLLGMKKLHHVIFDEKEWSTTSLLQETLKDLKRETISTSILTELNDIDTFEDLKKSSVQYLIDELKINTSLSKTKFGF